ncbi:F-box/LRR-repeat protein 7-like [Stegodyphus dumicola]|uniref:F-box/LRR-repeat protein 7-like n=1 Tax=Stegodyphus dumicola TaxID=202533 RepID=UPI0015A888AD|nr:F-box/LRR-repeat protein 7-like [Stegodyphus dumicola]
MACPKPTMEFYFNESRSVESVTDGSDTFSVSSTPKPIKDFRGSLYKPKLDPLSPYGGLAGRASPGHDLGYHTLLTRDSITPTPTQTPTVPRRTFDSLSCSSSSFRWSDVPSSMCNTSPYPRASDVMTPPPPPRNHIASTPSSTHPSSVSSVRSTGLNCSSQLLDTSPLGTTFKGKKSHKSSLFDKLSDDLILKIFSFLSSNYLCVCARVCRRWYFLAWEPQLWTSVCLSSEKIHVDRGLKTLFRLLCRDSPTVCLAVEKISLSGCCRLTDKGLFTIARRCPELKTLEIRGCPLVSDAGIAEVMARCVSILKLDLTGCQQITTIQPRSLSNEISDSVIDHPSSGSLHVPPQVVHHHQLFLQFLDLTDCHGLEDFGLKTIVRNSPQISHMYLRRCVQITDCGIKAIASFCMMLKELSISDCILVTDFGMYELAKLGSNLRYLSVAKCDQISDAGIKQIARHCYKLRYLNVRGCEAVSDHSMEVLSRSCPRLRALDIGKCDVTDNGLRLLSEHCPNLRKLSVKSCDMITDQGIQSIAFYCRGLQQLNIQDCNITVEGYRTVKKFCKRCIIEHTNPGFY